MKVRLAERKDLPQIKRMYKEIIKRMNENQVPIWDDIYPCEFFEEDIKNKQLYLMLENTAIISAFTLCDSNTGAGSVGWKGGGKALYLDRFGVNTGWLRKGIGSLMLTEAKKIAKEFGAEYLRLFVVDINLPAIRLYEHNGFARAAGVYDEELDADCVLHEYGYEIKL